MSDAKLSVKARLKSKLAAKRESKSTLTEKQKDLILDLSSGDPEIIKKALGAGDLEVSRAAIYLIGGRGFFF